MGAFLREEDIVSTLRENRKLHVMVRAELRIQLKISKGVIVEVRKDEDMPRDEHGRVIDMASDPMSLTKRMNLGKVIEPRITSTLGEYDRLLMADVLKEYSALLRHDISNTEAAVGVKNGETTLTQCRSVIESKSSEWRAEWFKRMLSLYELLSPKQHEGMVDYEDDDIVDFLTHALHEGFRIWLPTNNPVVYSDIYPELDKGHPCNKGKLRFRNSKGEEVVTVDDFVTGDLYMVVLEKLGKDISAVASSRIQSNGVPAKQSASDNGTNHTRNNPVRLPSETDLRWMLMAMGGPAVRDIQERSNSPEIHEEIYESILTADNPMDIEEAVDRSRFPMKFNRVAKQVRQLQLCNGVAISPRPTKTLEEVKQCIKI